MQIEAAKKRFTVDEYYKMDEAGILTEQDRTELIDGEIIVVSGMGPRHAAVLSRANDRFVSLFRGKALVRPQLPLRINAFNELQPDVALLIPRSDGYASMHPGAEDVLLVLEISDTSLRYDRDVKLKVYAATGVPELWIANLQDDILLVFRDPAAVNYKTSLSFRRGDSISCLAFPDIQFPVHELLA